MLKGKCIECSNKGFATLIFDGFKPVIGGIYKLIDITKGTLSQNNTFHDLIEILYDFMLKTDCFIIEDNGIIYDLSCSDPKELKNIVKAKYGKSFEKIFYADLNDNGKPILLECDCYELLPEHVKKDFKEGNKQRLKGKLFSWSDYTKANRKTVISRLLFIMDRYGVDDNKYLELRKYFDDKEISYINKIASKFEGEIKGE
jgi:hypothetical protein